MLNTYGEDLVEDSVLVMVLRTTKNIVKALVCEVPFRAIRFGFHQQWLQVFSTTKLHSLPQLLECVSHFSTALPLILASLCTLGKCF